MRLKSDCATFENRDSARYSGAGQFANGYGVGAVLAVPLGGGG